jgi:multidrug efflux pump subunit AcrA (membrane-fusion protein)
MDRSGIVANLALVALISWCTACSREPASVPSGAQRSKDANAAGISAIARGRVDVEGGLLQLTMPVEGRLVAVAVREGDHVTRGQELASADATAGKIESKVLQVKLEQARAQQRNLENRLALARTRAERLTEAARAGAGDGQSADDARDGAVQLAAELENVRAAGRIIAAELEQARYQLSKHILRAPMDGQVIRVAAQPGMSVSPQSASLFTLLPESPRIIRAELNGPFIASVRVGMAATIMTDDDAQIAAGLAHVLRIRSTFGLSALEDGLDPHIGERSVECVLAVDGDSRLRVGQRVLVRFDQTAAHRAR